MKLRELAPIVNEKVKKKYGVHAENKDALLLIGKRVVRVLCIVLFIKGMRLYFIQNEHLKEIMSWTLSQMDIEQLVQIVSVRMMVAIFIVVFGVYLIKGISILNHKWFTYMVLFGFIDLVLMYVFPEIYVTMFQTMFIEYVLKNDRKREEKMYV